MNTPEAPPCKNTFWLAIGIAIAYMLARSLMLLLSDSLG